MSGRNRKGLTPYQGVGRVFGEYECQKCIRRWMSANSWADKAQKCMNCDVWVYPHKQSALQKSDDISYSGSGEPHPQELCQMCKSIGHYCGR